MGRPPSITKLLQPLRAGWLGPHFYYDLIRLARKGWPTLARIAFLLVVLVSLLILNRTQGDSVRFTQPAEFARRAYNFAYLLIILQDLLILALLPVYIASAIVQEKENQTLEALTLTHLTDRELVLGKFFARLMHVGAFALANFPLLAFMHLWGNVDATMLVYHEINLFLMLLSAGSVCIMISTRSETAFNAISSSYGWLAFLGFVSMVASFALPFMLTAIASQLRFGVRRPPPGWDGPSYWSALVIVTMVHLTVVLFALRAAIARMEILRREERRNVKKTTGSLALTDNRPISKRTGKRGQTQSRVHPWAWPIVGDAMFWKECLKDGSQFSLSVRWLLRGFALVAVLAIVYHLLRFLPLDEIRRNNARGMAYTLTFTTYLISLAAYGLVVVFQMTMAVAAEREQGTLPFLLTIPDDRRAILWAKWLGPWWRNWPILAICYFGALLGFACGLYGVLGFLVLLLAPWPLLLMLAGMSLWLSVLCRRVLYANIAIVALAALLAMGHIAASEPAWIALAYYFTVVGEVEPMRILNADLTGPAWIFALGQQGIFLTFAGLCIGHAFMIFGKRDYSAS